MKYWKQVLGGILTGLLLSGLVRLITLPKTGHPITVVTMTPNLTPDPTAIIELIKVQVAGNVNQPGVYELVKGSNLDDAIRAAGGPSSTAKTDLINLVTVLEDGQRVYIPGMDDLPSSDLDQNQRSVELNLTGIVNINTASQQELESLPGIGAVKAKAIIEYRTQNGYFLSIDDLMKVSGIGQSIFSQVKDYITVTP